MAPTDGSQSQLDQDLDLLAQARQPNPPPGECFLAAGGALVLGTGLFVLGGLIPSSSHYADEFAWGTFGAVLVCCIVAVFAMLFAIAGGPFLRAIAARRFRRLPTDRKEAVTTALRSPATVAATALAAAQGRSRP